MRRSPAAPLPITPWLEAFGILAWGALLLKYWLTGELNVLIHPDYAWLTVAGGIGLSAVGAWKMLALRLSRRSVPGGDHTALIPPVWSATILIVTAAFGFGISPQPFASQTALELGVTDPAAVTRSQPQSFRAEKAPEERTLIDWTRTLSVYPEPEAYAGQKASIKGFVIHPPNLPDNYFVLARFVITCCAADAYPVGLPVQLSDRVAKNRSAYPADTWLRVNGETVAEEVGGKRQLVVLAKEIEEVPEPKNPYEV